MYKTSNLRLLACALGLLSVPTLGFAASSVTVTPVNMVGTTSATEPVTFDDIPTFDSSLGTLESVQFSLELDATPFLLITNTTKHTQGYRHALAFESGKISLEAPTTSGPSDFTVSAGKDEVPPSKGKLTKAGTPGDSIKIFGPEVDTTKVFTITDPTNMYSSSVLGDTYDLSAFFKELPGYVRGTAAAGVNFTGGDDLYSCLTVTYFYDGGLGDPAAPEPSTWALMGISLAALWFGRRFLVKRSGATIS